MNLSEVYRNYVSGLIHKTEFYDFDNWKEIPEAFLIDYFLAKKYKIDIYKIYSENLSFEIEELIVESNEIQHVPVSYTLTEYTILHVALFTSKNRLALKIMKSDTENRLISLILNGISPFSVACSKIYPVDTLLKYIINNNIPIQFNYTSKHQIRLFEQFIVPFDETNPMHDKYSLDLKQIIFKRYYDKNKFNIIASLIRHTTNELNLLNCIMYEVDKCIDIVDDVGVEGAVGVIPTTEDARTETACTEDLPIEDKPIEDACTKDLPTKDIETINSEIVESNLRNILNLFEKFKDIEIMHLLACNQFTKIVKYLLHIGYVCMQEPSSDTLLIDFMTTGYSEAICIELFQKSTNKSKILGKVHNNCLQHSLVRGYYSLTKLLLKFDNTLFEVTCKDFNLVKQRVLIEYVAYPNIFSIGYLLDDYSLFKFVVDTNLVRGDHAIPIIENAFKYILLFDILKNIKYFMNRYEDTIDIKILSDNIEWVEGACKTIDISTDKYVECIDFYKHVKFLIEK